MKLVKRRNILAGLAGAAGLELLTPLISICSAGPTHAIARDGFLITGDVAALPTEKQEGYLNKAQISSGVVNFLSLSNFEISSTLVPFFPHGFAFTKDGKRAVACEKWGPTAAVLNLKSKSIERLIHAPNGATFFGHACFPPDEKTLVLSGQVASGEGALFVYQARENWNLIEAIYIPRKVHEVKALSNQLVAFAVSCHGLKPDVYGGQGALQILDLKTKKNVEFWSVSDASHILQLNKDEFIVSGCIDFESELPVAYINTKSGFTKSIASIPAFKGMGLKGEGLSLASLSSDEVLITVPITKQLLVWNFRSGRLVDLKIKDQPLGLYVISETEFLVSGLSKSLRKYRYRKDDGVISEAEVVANRFGNGRHIYAI